MKHKLNLIAIYVADKAFESTIHKTLIQISKEKTLHGKNIYLNRHLKEEEL